MFDGKTILENQVCQRQDAFDRVSLELNDLSFKRQMKLTELEQIEIALDRLMKSPTGQMQMEIEDCLNKIKLLNARSLYNADVIGSVAGYVILVSILLGFGVMSMNLGICAICFVLLSGGVLTLPDCLKFIKNKILNIKVNKLKKMVNSLQMLEDKDVLNKIVLLRRARMNAKIFLRRIDDDIDILKDEYDFALEQLNDARFRYEKEKMDLLSLNHTDDLYPFELLSNQKPSDRTKKRILVR